jgi:hypothetical protein
MGSAAHSANSIGIIGLLLLWNTINLTFPISKNK